MSRHSPVRRLVVLLAAAIAFASTAPGAAAETPDPILLVHGFTGEPSSFDTMVAHFTAAGRTAVAIDLPSEDNIVNARAIRDFIDARRASDPAWGRVDIVAHSMGGLSSRYYLKALNGRGRVDSYVSLGTPHYGAWAACLLPQSYGGQMCPTSTFLKNLNKGDDTPGAVDYGTLYSTDDATVSNSSSRLDGGACFIQVSGVSHSGLLTDQGVFDLVIPAIDGSCPGTFKA
ncbi:MAG TPA: alpha/beta fold hydrolase [Candidatus Limnocylindrales bacterium]|nr:alpha/beta fold hydrolase [Candidatus Limnocylindrales bacterium]